MAGSSGGTASSSGATSSSSGGATSSSSGGATSSSSGAGTPSLCDGTGTRVLTTAATDAFVDDFEEPMLSPGWSSFNDVMGTGCGGTGMPSCFLITQVAGGAAGTAHSGHYAGMGAKLATAGGFGVGLVYNTAIDPGAGIYCINISVFDGVSFWAKAATAGSKITVNFVLPSTNKYTTDMTTGKPNGGDCTSATACYNHPRVPITLTTTWAQYTATFAAAAGGSAKVGNVIQELAFLSPDTNWDFSLDEIAFYKGTPPAGAVGTGSAIVDAGAGGQ